MAIFNSYVKLPEGTKKKMLGYHNFSYWHCHELGPPPTPVADGASSFPQCFKTLPLRGQHSIGKGTYPDGQAWQNTKERGRVAQRMLELSSIGFRPFGAEMVLKLGMIPQMHFELDILGQEYPQYFGPMLRSSSFSDVDSAKANSVTGRSTRLGRFDASCSGKAGRRPDQVYRIQEWFQPKAPSQWIWGDPPAGSREQPHLSRQDARTGVQCTGPAIAKTSWCAMLATRICGHDFFMTSAGFPPAM